MKIGNRNICEEKVANNGLSVLISSNIGYRKVLKDYRNKKRQKIVVFTEHKWIIYWKKLRQISSVYRNEKLQISEYREPIELLRHVSSISTPNN